MFYLGTQDSSTIKHDRRHVLTLICVWYRCTGKFWAKNLRVRRVRDRMEVGFTIAYSNQCLLPLTLWVHTPLRRVVLYTIVWDKVCQWLVVGLWFSPGTLVSSTNKTDCNNITEILLKVVLNTITLALRIWHSKHIFRLRILESCVIILSFHEVIYGLVDLISFRLYNYDVGVSYRMTYLV